MFSTDLKTLKKLLPKRSKTANKTDGGKCLVIAGSRNMPGAGVLAAKAAARTGAGYVYLCTEQKNKQIPPDFILTARNKKIDFGTFQAVAIGPGLGTSAKSQNEIKKWLNQLRKINFKNVVIDADAINFLSKHSEVLPLPPDWVVTPHAGELSRLLKLPRSMKPEERSSFLAAGQKKLGCTLVLKGAPTYIFDGKKKKTVNFGNKALAKAGTGDVLTGMIAGFMAQGLSPDRASYLAAALHGLMADEWVKSKDYLSLMASDLIEMLPGAIFKLRR